MKFGGTSIAGAACIGHVADLVLAARDRQPLVVTSALAGVTSRLLAAADAAWQRREIHVADHLRFIRETHAEAAFGLGLGAAALGELERAIDSAMGCLSDLTRGVSLLGECTPRTRDAIAAIGELVSHRLVAAAMASRGAAVEAVDPRTLLLTDDRFGEAQPISPAIHRACAERVSPFLARGAIVVTGGFVGATLDGVTTTLGRGGSDLSATLLGVALSADEVQIWTDVDGMMTADPRTVPAARTLPEVTFQEAAELAYFGAKVLHPATIRPAVEHRIPVRILNTFRPDGAGTVIGPGSRGGVTEPRVRAVAWKRGITTISVSSPRMLGASGFLSRVFAVFERHRTPIDVVTTSEVSVSMTVDRQEHVDAIAADLAEICQVRVEPGMSLICVVGRHFLQAPELVGRILSEVAPAPLRMACLGSSDINLSLVVRDEHAQDVVRRLHSSLIESAP